MTITVENSATMDIFVRRIWAMLVILCILFFPKQVSGNSQVEDMNNQNHKDLIHAQDCLSCYEFFSPFSESDRQGIAMIKKRVVGVFGEYRRSYKPGHHHAGLDLWGASNETVYAIGYGWVVRIFGEFPNRSVVIEHHLADGRILYSMYVHIEDIRVEVGDWVDEHTPLGRVFDKEELKRANFNTPNHLHLEIRKSLADRGRASIASMSMKALCRFCLDPLHFFKKKFFSEARIVLNDI